MPVTDEIKRIYASAPHDSFMVETLGLKHSRFTQPFYINNTDKDWTFLLETGTSQDFISAPFGVELPANNTEGGQELTIMFANFGRAILDEIEAAAQLPTEPIIAEYRVYLNIADSLPQNDPVLQMSIYGIAVNNEFISASAGRFDILNNKFPRVLYKTEYFPGLKR